MMERTTPLEPGVYIELGVGANDFPTNPTMLVDEAGNIGPRHFINGAHYVGLDRPYIAGSYRDDVRDRLIDEIESTGGRKYSTRRTIGKLAAAMDYLTTVRPNESITFMAADAHNLPFPDESIRGVYAGDVLSSQLATHSIANILSEVRRVLQPDGTFVTRECFTPHWYNEAHLRSTATEAGLKVISTAYYGSSTYQDLASEFGATIFEISPYHKSKDFMYFATMRPTD